MWSSGGLITVSPATQGASALSSEGEWHMAEEQLRRELRAMNQGLGPQTEFYSIQFSGGRDKSFTTHEHKHSMTRKGGK